MLASLLPKRISDISPKELEAGGNTMRFHEEIFSKEIYKDAISSNIVVDVGANVGLFSLYMAPFSKKIYALEPHLESFEKLKSNTSGYENIKPINKALWSHTGEYTMHEEGDGGHSLVVGDRNLIVKTTTLSDLIKDEGIKWIDVLKIDCESSEKQFMPTVEFKTALSKVNKVVGEFHDNGDLVKSIFKDCGFIFEEYSNSFYAHR